MKTLQTQYNLIKEGKGDKAYFMKLARYNFPDLITPVLSYNDTITVLKNKSILSEGIGGVVTKGKTPDWHSIFKENITEATKEAKAEEKEPTKEVTDMATRGYDYKDYKNIDNIFGETFLKGFYTEMQDPKNEDKTVEELKQIVAKNLAKDCLHYTKEGQFGIKGVGYTTEAPGLGTPKEAKGKHKSSGYGDLKESVLRSQIYLLVKEVLTEDVNKPTEEEKKLNALKEKALKQAGEAISSTGTNTHKVVFDHDDEKTVAIAFRDSEEKANKTAEKLKKTGLLKNVKVTSNK